MNLNNKIMINNQVKLHTIYIDQSYEHNGKTFSNGIDYVKYRRLNENWIDPIVFTSFLSFQNILTQKGTSIVTSVGHEFLQLPYSKKDLDIIKENIYELDTIDLNDIKLHYCQISGVFSNSFHNFKARLQAVFGNNSINSIVEINDLFNNYFLELYKEYSFIPKYSDLINELQIYKKEIITNIENPPINEQQERFLKFLPNEETEQDDFAYNIKPKPWKALFLEDNPDEIKNVTDILDIKEIQYKIFSNYKKAEDELNTDNSNQYTVIISDFRLIEGNRHQAKQGYRFLIETARKNRLNGLIALSGLSKWFLMDSFRNIGLDIKVFSKGAIVKEGARLFVDEIENLGDKYYDAIINRPKAAGWENLKQYYAYYRISKDYDKLEDNICLHSSEITEEIKIAIHSKDSLKQIKSISTYITEAQVNFDNTTYKNINETTLKKFYDKLIIRRVLIYMYLWDENSLTEVCELLAKNLSSKLEYTNKQNKSGKTTNGNKKQIMTNCGLKEEDIPINILSEEVNWLDKMGVEIKGYKVAFNGVHELFEFFFENYPIEFIKKRFQANFTKDKSLKAMERNFKDLNKQLRTDSANQIMIAKFYHDLKHFLNILDNAYVNNQSITNFINQISSEF